MPRRSKRKQNRKINHKQNSCKKINTNVENQNLNIKNAVRVNIPAAQISEKENSSQNKNLQFEFESDSDPDIFFEFHPDSDIIKAKSDSALKKVNKYNPHFKSLETDIISQINVNEDKIELPISIDSCRNTLTDSVSTTRTIDSSNVDIKFLNSLKSCSALDIDMTCCRTPRDLSLPLDLVKGIHKEDMQHSDLKLGTIKQGRFSLVNFSSEVKPKIEKSYENLTQQKIIKNTDEAFELNFTTCPPKRLDSSSNILMNDYMTEFCGKRMLVEKSNGGDFNERLCNKHFPENLPESGDEESIEGNKIYFEKTKNEKQFLNNSILGEEPCSRSTPLIKTKSKDKWKSYTEVAFDLPSESNLENTREEYYTCCKETPMKSDSKNGDESLNHISQYISCRDIKVNSKEVFQIFPFETSESAFPRPGFRNISVQCDLIKSEVELLVEKEWIENVEEKEQDQANNLNVSLSSKLGERRHFNFKTFKKLFTKVSIQKFLHILSVMPLDKLLEFFCLTFSIPLIETMAISISVTKLMDIISSATVFLNFNHQLKHFSCKTLDYLKMKWGNFTDIIIKHGTFSIRPSEEIRMCLCDVQKLTDLEKRLKNLENELTKFKFLDTELEKLKDGMKNFQQPSVQMLSTASFFTAPPPVPPPPPPPLPPPPPPPPTFQASSAGFLIKPKKNQQNQNTLTRPSITVEDLQKVILRKVTTNEKQGQDIKKGPVVSLEMLRSVKLRSSARKKTPTCSPTRTPTSRERIRRIKSPFRSGSRSRDRKSRYPNIPLSEILGMDDSYQLFDHKSGESQKKDLTPFY